MYVKERSYESPLQEPLEQMLSMLARVAMGSTPQHQKTWPSPNDTSVAGFDRYVAVLWS